MNLMRISLVFLAMALSSLLFAQQNVILEKGNTQVGTIQELNQGDGLIVISGRRYVYSNAMLSVFYDGNLVDSYILDQGMVVRYVVNADLVVTQMELLGPNDKIQAYFQH